MRALDLARRSWRQLTSMRTALVLLFLLAVAAIPGSLLPQRRVNIEQVSEYLRTNGERGRWFDRLGLFDVYSSPWFSAIYLLLFTSLVGCLVPRLRTHLSALLRTPPDAPLRLDRMPVHARVGATGPDPAGHADRLRELLRSRRFRTTVRRHPDGSVTVSAEKGYLKETGNLLFHFALLGLLVAVALGSWYGWHGNRLVVAGPEGAFCDTVAQYDDYGLGARVPAGGLPPFCLQLEGFQARYLADGQPVAFRAAVRYTEGGGPERATAIEVNHPLRMGRATVYLIGHGYAPVLRYTDRFGRAQTAITPFLPRDGVLTSAGVATFPDANVDRATGTRDPRGQIAFSGIYLPTLPPDPSVGRSLHPEERDPGLMLVAYRGNLGMDAGIPHSVYTLDQRQLASGALATFGEPRMMHPGDSWTLPDGSTVAFLGTRPWITASVRHDPGERPVLVAAVFLLLGLLASLTGRRRRVWFRLTGGAVEAGGLPRTDYPGFATEFDEIARSAAAVGPAGRPPGDLVTASPGVNEERST